VRSVYKCVTNVTAGMQAAFVDIGRRRTPSSTPATTPPTSGDFTRASRGGHEESSPRRERRRRPAAEADVDVAALVQRRERASIEEFCTRAKRSWAGPRVVGPRRAYHVVHLAPGRYLVYIAVPHIGSRGDP